MFWEISQDWGKHDLSDELLAVSDTNPDEFLKDLKHLVDCQLITLFDAQEKGSLHRGISHGRVSPLEIVFEHFVLDETANYIPELLPKSISW